MRSTVIDDAVFMSIMILRALEEARCKLYDKKLNRFSAVFCER